MRKEDKKFDEELSQVEFQTESETRDKEIINLLKQLVNQNKQVIQLLTKLQGVNI